MSSSGNKNNTSRFAFSGEEEQQMAAAREHYMRQNPQYQVEQFQESADRAYPRVPEASSGQRQAQSSSTWNDQSLVTPNLSNGGQKLQTQLEQVLMMKSGEFSANGQRPGEQIQVEEDYVQQEPYNYGNPNFIPPGHNYYRERYPATYQEQPHSSSYGGSQNFNTSQFAAGQESPEQNLKHQRTNSRTKYAGIQAQGNNFTLQRPQQVSGPTDYRISSGRKGY